MAEQDRIMIKQKEIYDKGFAEGAKAAFDTINYVYSAMCPHTCKEVFGKNESEDLYRFIGHADPIDVIEKVKEYREERVVSVPFSVGDIVIHKLTGEKVWVTKINCKNIIMFSGITAKGTVRDDMYFRRYEATGKRVDSLSEALSEMSKE